MTKTFQVEKQRFISLGQGKYIFLTLCWQNSDVSSNIHFFNLNLFPYMTLVTGQNLWFTKLG